MGRAHAKKQRLCHSVSQTFQQPQWTKIDLHSNESELEKPEQIFGHQIVASANVLWCIGGYRPVEQVKISLIALDLHSLQWDDLTPGEDSVAPTWRWGHSACVLEKHALKRPTDFRVMLCGGFSKNCNFNEVWHFCPSSGTFAEPPIALQQLPIRGAYHSLVHDAFSDEVYLFGGQRCVGGPYIYSNSVFVAQLHRHRCGWKELLTSGQKPQAREQHCAVITESGTMVVYGGAHASSTLHDVWALDVRKTPAVWAEVRPFNGPPCAPRSFPPRNFQVISSRPFMAAHGSSIVIAGEAAGHLTLWVLHSGRWYQVPAAGAPAWTGNFAAILCGECSKASQNKGNKLLVFGGESCGTGRGHNSLCSGGFWSLDFILQPSAILQGTLRVQEELPCQRRHLRPLWPLQWGTIWMSW